MSILYKTYKSNGFTVKIHCRPIIETKPLKLYAFRCKHLVSCIEYKHFTHRNKVKMKNSFLSTSTECTADANKNTDFRKRLAYHT